MNDHCRTGSMAHMVAHHSDSRRRPVPEPAGQRRTLPGPCPRRQWDSPEPAACKMMLQTEAASGLQGSCGSRLRAGVNGWGQRRGAGWRVAATVGLLPRKAHSLADGSEEAGEQRDRVGVGRGKGAVGEPVTQSRGSTLEPGAHEGRDKLQERNERRCMLGKTPHGRKS